MAQNDSRIVNLGLLRSYDAALKKYLFTKLGDGMYICEDYEEFMKLKVSADAGNTTYRIGDGQIQSGTPDVSYRTQVYFKNANLMWVGGRFYQFTGDIPVPTKTSELENDKGFLTGEVVGQRLVFGV